jgi:hypothetical protein
MHFKLLALALFVMAFVGIVYCPFDNLASQWDGNTQVVNGVLWYEYKCPSGHVFLQKP